MPDTTSNINRDRNLRKFKRRIARYEKIKESKRSAKAKGLVYSPYRPLAQRYVKAALECGDLPVLDGTIKCSDCDELAFSYDHRDYMKPLEVEPVCIGCNAKRGSGLNAWRDGKPGKNKGEYSIYPD